MRFNARKYCYMSKAFSLHLFTRDIFEADNYSPIPVANEEEYRIVISKFPFQDPELDKVRETFMLLKVCGNPVEDTRDINDFYN